MNPLHRLALATYYACTLPYRRRAHRQRCGAGTVPISVLFYHRVANAPINDWTIQPKSFRRQIEWITKRFEIVSLCEAQRRLRSGNNDRPAVCITFDDGYWDNCQFAVPFLLERRIPFVYFVASSHVLDDVPFPHDVAAGVPLRPNTLQQLTMMAEAGVEIGAHTRTHANLGALNEPDALEGEIAGSKYELQNALGIEVRYFAFPYGMPENMSTEAFATAWQAGFIGVCSAYGAYNLPGGDAVHIRRIHGDCQLIRLKNWLTVDPRKLNRGDLFSPGQYRARRPRSAHQETLKAGEHVTS